MGYVKTTLDSFDDIYSLAIASYAAQLANHPSKTAFMQKLDKLAKVEGMKNAKLTLTHTWRLLLSIKSFPYSSGDLKYWEKVKLTTPSDPWCQPPSVNVEITAYALLSYIKAGRVIDGLPIMRWLLSQQSSTGGFSSTQDTVKDFEKIFFCSIFRISFFFNPQVMGITALATFAGEISGANVMSCTISHGSGQSTIKINKDNSLVLQSVEVTFHFV